MQPLRHTSKRLHAGVLQSRSGGGTSRKLVNSMLHESGGVLWTRVYVNGKASSFCPALESVLNLLGAHQMVVGHSVMPGGKPRVLCDGRLYMMDVGMSRAYGGAKATVWKCHEGLVSILQ